MGRGRRSPPQLWVVDAVGTVQPNATGLRTSKDVNCLGGIIRGGVENSERGHLPEI